MTDSLKPAAAKRRSSSRLLASTSVFLKPYLTQITIASVALVFTAALTLGLVQYVRLIVDRGFVEGSTESLNTAILGFLIVAVPVRALPNINCGMPSLDDNATGESPSQSTMTTAFQEQCL